MAEEILYDQIDQGGGDPDPYGLKKKAAALKSKPDPYGLRQKAEAIKRESSASQQPAFQIQLSQPTFTSVPAKTGAREFTYTQETGPLDIYKLEGKAKVAHDALKKELESNRDVKLSMVKHRSPLAKMEDQGAAVISDMPRSQSDIDIKRLGLESKRPTPKADVITEEQDLTTANEYISSDRNNASEFLKEVAKKYPDKEREIQKNTYLLDAFNSAANDPNGNERAKKIEQNAKAIEKGDIIYDHKTQTLIKPESFFSSLFEGRKELNRLSDAYDSTRKMQENGNEAGVISELNSKLQRDPDDPIPTPTGFWGEMGHMLGSQPIKGLAAGGVAAAGVSLSGNPEAAGSAFQLASGAMNAVDMYKIGYQNALEQNYVRIKQENPEMPDYEAYKKADSLADKQAVADAAMAGAMQYFGAKVGLSAAKNLQKGLASGLSQIKDELGKKAFESLGIGGIGAAGQTVKNILAQNEGLNVETTEGVFDMFKSGVMMTGAMAMLGMAYNQLKPSTRNRLTYGLSQMPEEAINGSLDKLEQSGQLTPDQTAKVRDAINEQKAFEQLIPNDLPETDRLKIGSKIKERADLKQKLEQVDEAFHPEIKEKIKKINEDIIGLSKGEKRGDLQSIVHKAIKNDEVKGYATDPLRNASEGELKGYMKEIAEQIYLGNEEATIDTFGESIVNKAKELFPQEAPKETKISVIQPGEIKQPETITISPREQPSNVPSTEKVSVIMPKTKDNAVSERIPAQAIVDEAPGSGQPVGEGVPESGEAAIPQEGQPTVKAESTPTSKEGEIGLPPTEEAPKVGVYAEHPPTQISFRGLQEVANEFGYDDVKSRDRVSDIQERKNAEVTANEWAQKGEYQSRIDDLLNKIEAKEMVPTAKQRLILEQYLANERQKARGMNKFTPEYDAQIRKVARIKQIGEIARQETGAALRLPNEGTLPHPITDETAAMSAKMEANAVDNLTDQQKQEVLSQVEKYKQANDEANAKIAQLQEQVAKLDAEKEFKKAKSATKRTKKTTEERVAYRKSEIEAAREALKKLRSGESGLSAVPLPGVRELMAIAPHVKNIMVDLIEQGATELGEVIKKIHDEFKDVLEGVTEKDIHDIIAGKYNEKRKPLSELQSQVRDLQDEAKLINQLESLLNGKEPKDERAKRQRNQKIKDLKDKIKDFRKEERESNKFYGESDAGERRLDKLRDELERIQSRREKEKPKEGSKEYREISEREQSLRDQIKDAQEQWDNEKQAARDLKDDYRKLEAERNRQMQRVSELKEKLDKLQKGIKPEANKVVKKKDTPEIEAIKKEVADAEKKLNETIATEKRIKSLENELERLQKREDKQPKETQKRDISEREKELKDLIAEERKTIKTEEREANKFYKEELDSDAKKLIAIKKRNDRAAQELKDKISIGEFEKEEKQSIFDREDIKRNYPNLRKDALDAISKKEDARHEFDLALFEDERSRWSTSKKLLDFVAKLVHTSKSIMAGIDDSATFVQNGLAMLSNPKIGAKVWVKHWREAFNEKRFKRELEAIHQSPDWDVMQKSGLDVVEQVSDAAKKAEEAFEQNLLAGKFKIGEKEYQPWKYTGGIFERAFASMGNNMRVELFRKRVAQLLADKKTFESNPQDYKDAARVINEMTGRGKQNKYLEQASPAITPFIWAPRMLASTFNLLGISDIASYVGGSKIGTEGYYRTLTPAQRRFALTQVGRGIAVGVVIMGAAALGGAKVDYDPFSVTFGDVIIGTHHYNVFGRFMPVVKTIIQAASGRRDTKSGIKDLDNPKTKYDKTRGEVVESFFRGKVTPAVGTALNLWAGKDYFTHEEFGIKDVPKSLLQPMAIKDLIEGWKNDGTWGILNRFLPAFEGLKATDERDFKKLAETSSSGGKSQKQGKPKKPTKHTKN